MWDRKLLYFEIHHENDTQVWQHQAASAMQGSKTK
jgi:hypothetical protein